MTLGRLRALDSTSSWVRTRLTSNSRVEMRMPSRLASDWRMRSYSAGGRLARRRKVAASSSASRATEDRSLFAAEATADTGGVGVVTGKECSKYAWGGAAGGSGGTNGA